MQSLQQYEEIFARAIQQQYPLGESDRQLLAGLRQVLNLSKATTRSLEKQIVREYKQKIQQYEAAFTKAIHQQYPLRDETWRQLQRLRQSLGLREEIIHPIEVQVAQTYEQKLQQYEVVFTRAIQQQCLLSNDHGSPLEDLQQVVNLSEKQIVREYKQKIQQYEAAFTKAIHQQYPLRDEAHQLLHQLQRNLGLEKEVTESIEVQVNQGYEQKLQQYEEIFTKAIQRQYPLGESDRRFLANLRQAFNLNPQMTDSIEVLANLQQVLNLSEEVTDSIEARVIATHTLNSSLPTVSGNGELGTGASPILKSQSPTTFNSSLLTRAPRKGKHQEQGRQQLVKVVVVAAVLASVGLAIRYTYSLWQTNQFAEAVLNTTRLQKERKNYEGCIDQAKQDVLQKSPFYGKAENLLRQCQRLAQDEQWLAQAKAFATRHNFRDAIAEARKIQPDSRFRQEAQQFISQWSGNLLQQAEGQYAQSGNSKDLQDAISVAKAIPQTSLIAQQAEEKTMEWQAEWSQNETHLQEAENALNERKWQEAITKANQVRLLGQEVKQEAPYWQHKLQPIVARAEALSAASNSQVIRHQASGMTQQSVPQESVTRQVRGGVKPTPTTQQPITQSSSRQFSTQRSTAQRSATQPSTTQPSPPQSSSSGGWPSKNL